MARNDDEWDAIEDDGERLRVVLRPGTTIRDPDPSAPDR